MLLCFCRKKTNIYGLRMLSIYESKIEFILILMQGFTVTGIM